eukprot:4942105-Amphidinium_carterae.1
MPSCDASPVGANDASAHVHRVDFSASARGGLQVTNRAVRLTDQAMSGRDRKANQFNVPDTPA